MTQAGTSAYEAALQDHVELGMPHTIARLAELVRIPSVSWDDFDRNHVRASADRVRELLAQTGLFERVEIHEYTDELGRQGQPGVIAVRKAAPGYPTVLLYAHHDVQPPGDDEAWNDPAFTPTVRGDRLYGRGASDDKAGVMLHVAALEALRDTLDGDVRIGLSVFIEGEEEHGSRTFETFLTAHADDLASDAIIVADSDNASISTPSLTVALRGNVAVNLTVTTLEHASHSGMYGGVAPDAMLATIRLLDSLWDARGEVSVVGLVPTADMPLGEAAQSTDDADVRREAGFLEGVQAIGTGSVSERLWFKPAITVTGIDAPSVAHASNTLVPSVTVRISARVAPGQDAHEAAEALESHLRAHTPFGAHLSFGAWDIGQPFLVDTSSEAATLMLDSMRDAWGAAPVQAGVGGSIPFIAQLAERNPGATILVTGVEDPATRAHSPNESQHLGVLKRAILTEVLFLSRLNSKPVV